MDFNPQLYNEKYRIPTTRRQNKNYSKGHYHVVVCTKNKKCYFGEIYNDEIHYTPIGEYAKQCIENLTHFYPYAEVQTYQVMPNHIHLLISLSEEAPCAAHPTHIETQDDKEQCKREFSTQNIRQQHEEVCQMVMGETQGDIPTKSHNRKGGLSILIGGLKRAITKWTKKHDIDFAWQERFYDTIIRVATQYSETVYYINSNVAKWSDDDMNVSATRSTTI